MNVHFNFLHTTWATSAPAKTSAVGGCHPCYQWERNSGVQNKCTTAADQRRQTTGNTIKLYKII